MEKQKENNTPEQHRLGQFHLSPTIFRLRYTTKVHINTFITMVPFEMLQSSIELNNENFQGK